MARLRKDQTEALVGALDSATSGPLEEITVARRHLVVALRIVLESDADWHQLIAAAAARDDWPDERRSILELAGQPDLAPDAEAVLEAMWELITELNERRTLD